MRPEKKYNILIIATAWISAVVFFAVHGSFKDADPGSAAKVVTASSQVSLSIQDAVVPDSVSQRVPSPSASAELEVRKLRLDPVSIAALDPALQKWMNTWQADFLAGKGISQEQSLNLRLLLESTKLDAKDLLDMAHAFHHLSKDLAISAEFYRAASLKLEIALNQPEQDPERSLRLLHSVLQHIQDLKDVMWPLIEDPAIPYEEQKRYARVLYRIYSSFVTAGRIVNDDAILASLNHPTIGTAECLYILEQDNNALKWLETLEFKKMDISEKTGFEWIDGAILFRQGNFKEAADRFHEVSENRSFKYARNASEILPAALAMSGDISNADKALDKWISDWKPPISEVAPVLAVIDKKRNELK